MSPFRRQWMTTEDEGLLAESSPFLAISRFGRFVKEWGLPPETVVPPRVVTIPVPMLIRSDRPPASAAMWHPLMWLPRHMREKYRVGERYETNDEWAVRVCVGLHESGLYDPETGTWEDVLAPLGLSVEDPTARKRFAVWAEGGRDPVLDRIDLTERFDLPVCRTALVSETRETLCCAWGMGADAMLEMLTGYELDPPDVAYGTAVYVAYAAQGWFVGAERVNLRMLGSIVEGLASATTTDEVDAWRARLIKLLNEAKDQYWWYVSEAKRVAALSGL